MEISFKEFFGYLLKRWWIIVAAALTGFIVAFLFSTFLIDKNYESRIVFAYEDSANNDLLQDKKFVERSVLVPKENVYLRELVKYLERNHSPDDFNLAENQKLSRRYDGEALKKAIKTNYNTLTLTLEFIVVTVNANDSFLIADAMANDEMLKELANIIGIPSTQYTRFKSIAEADLNNNPVSPNVPLNSIIGLFLGLITGVLLCFLIEKLDVRIRGEKDLMEKYNLPILGMIPSFSDEEVIK